MLEGSKSLVKRATRKVFGPNKSFSQNASLFTLAKCIHVPSIIIIINDVVLVNVFIIIVVVTINSSAEGRAESNPMVLFNDLSAILRSRKKFHIITGP